MASSNQCQNPLGLVPSPVPTRESAVRSFLVTSPVQTLESRDLGPSGIRAMPVPTPESAICEPLGLNPSTRKSAVHISLGTSLTVQTPESRDLGLSDISRDLGLSGISATPVPTLKRAICAPLGSNPSTRESAVRSFLVTSPVQTLESRDLGPSGIRAMPVPTPESAICEPLGLNPSTRKSAVHISLGTSLTVQTPESRDLGLSDISRDLGLSGISATPVLPLKCAICVPLGSNNPSPVLTRKSVDQKISQSAVNGASPRTLNKVAELQSSAGVSDLPEKHAALTPNVAIGASFPSLSAPVFQTKPRGHLVSASRQEKFALLLKWRANDTCYKQGRAVQCKNGRALLVAKQLPDSSKRVPSGQSAPVASGNDNPPLSSGAPPAASSDRSVPERRSRRLQDQATVTSSKETFGPKDLPKLDPGHADKAIKVHAELMKRVPIPCLVCGCLHGKHVTKEFSSLEDFNKDALSKSIASVCTWPPNFEFPADLKREYDMSPVLGKGFSDCALSPYGVDINGESVAQKQLRFHAVISACRSDVITVRVCDDCASAVGKKRIPAWAICNGHYYGMPFLFHRPLHVPEDVSKIPSIVSYILATHLPFSLLQVFQRQRTKLVGRTSIIESAEPTIASNTVPAMEANGESRFRVFIMSNRDTTDENDALDRARIYFNETASVVMVRSIFQWFKDNGNPVYANVTLDNDKLHSYVISRENFVVVGGSGSSSSGAAAPQTSDVNEDRVGVIDISDANCDTAVGDVPDTHLGPRVPDNPTNGNAHVATTTFLMRDLDIESEEMRKMAQDHLLKNTADVGVQRGSRFASADEKGVIQGIRPLCFPFGFGPVDPTRRVHTTFEEEAKRIINEAGAHRSQDMNLLAVLFSTIRVRSLMQSSFMRIVRAPSVAARIVTITADDLERSFGSRRDTRRTDPSVVLDNTPPSTSTTSSTEPPFKRGDDACWAIHKLLSCVVGTDDSRRSMADQARAMCQWFGMPTFFLSFNASDADSPTLYAYTAVRCTIARADGFEKHFEIPTRDEAMTSAAKNPAGQATYMYNLLVVLFKTVFGVDLEKGKTGSQSSRKAVFETDGVFLTIETSGRGTLHAHSLIWLKNMPRTRKQFLDMRAANPDVFDQALFAFYETAMDFSYDVKSSEYVCPSCASVGSMSDVQVPPLCYKLDVAAKLAPPLVSTCTACGTPTTLDTLLSTTFLTQATGARPSDTSRTTVANFAHKYAFEGVTPFVQSYN